MPRSCKCIVKKLKYKGAITDSEYEKLMRNLSAEVKHGKWIYLDGLDAFECSVCGRQMVRNIFDYCPWCGADMRKETEQE